MPEALRTIDLLDDFSGNADPLVAAHIPPEVGQAARDALDSVRSALFDGLPWPEVVEAAGGAARVRAGVLTILGGVLLASEVL